MFRRTFGRVNVAAKHSLMFMGILRKAALSLCEPAHHTENELPAGHGWVAH
jgi:hypothetical protein